jgi:hypothetical protein
VNFHQKIIIESNVPLGQRENKGTSSVPDEGREIIERTPMFLSFRFVIPIKPGIIGDRREKGK